MIKVSFYTKDGYLCGFEFSGHSGFADPGTDTICASVSAVAYMTANTITDVIGLKADIKVGNGFLKLMLDDKLSDAQQILEGLRLYLESLSEDYPDNIKVTSIRRCQNA
jgi:uncharacterized protein YsxB (DUF464 family)